MNNETANVESANPENPQNLPCRFHYTDAHGYAFPEVHGQCWVNGEPVTYASSVEELRPCPPASYAISIDGKEPLPIQELKPQGKMLLDGRDVFSYIVIFKVEVPS